MKYVFCLKVYIVRVRNREGVLEVEGGCVRGVGRGCELGVH